VRFRSEAKVSSGLTRRIVVASGLLALIVAAAFAVVLFSIADLRTFQHRTSHAQQVLTTSNELERLLLDLETGQRGFILTGQTRFLQPWTSARARLPARAKTLLRLVSGNASELRLARRIARDETSYIRDYSVPLVNAARRGQSSARSVSEVVEGKLRVDHMRADFDRLIVAEEHNFARWDARADAAALRAKLAAAAGLAGSIALIALYAGYVTRAIVRPVRRAARMADRLAGGDLGTRTIESGPDEVGALERSFNVMADSLERSRDELAASRARVVAAADETRRQIERDLHDGAQQRLVSLALALRAAQASVPPGGELDAQLANVAEGLARAVDELREMARGIHPAILSEGGLGPALRALARRSPIPVELDVRSEGRLPEGIEVAAYYVVAEALTNAAKHARASVVHVDAVAGGGALRLAVRDDGSGGADPAGGTGLIGLNDRVEALRGTIAITSPPGGGTWVDVTLPLGE
jgi:signal transduction histidine kinase